MPSEFAMVSVVGSMLGHVQRPPQPRHQLVRRRERPLKRDLLVPVRTGKMEWSRRGSGGLAENPAHDLFDLAQAPLAAGRQSGQRSLPSQLSQPKSIGDSAVVSNSARTAAR